uniref:Uncharacterized protein n=1 Tax=Anguilla anguilla TaxID=7936 RepID=A0A0E9QSP0_ANGAN
MEKLVGQAE